MDVDTFKATYSPDSAKWSRAQKEFYGKYVNDAREDAIAAPPSPESAAGRKAQHCENASGSVKNADSCQCVTCRGMLGAAKAQRELTGHDYETHK